MYHERTMRRMRRARRRAVALAVAAALVVALVIVLAGRLRAVSREQGAVALREAVLAAAERCCAVEGGYPQSLGYLEDRYGLRVNDRDYVVTYECFASNVMPSVVVVPR